MGRKESCKSEEGTPKLRELEVERLLFENLAGGDLLDINVGALENIPSFSRRTPITWLDESWLLIVASWKAISESNELIWLLSSEMSGEVEYKAKVCSQIPLKQSKSLFSVVVMTSL